jgi:hypothetical protein
MSAGRAISLWDMRYPAAFTYNPNSNRDSASQHAQLNMKLAQVVVKFTSSLSSTGTGTLSQIWLPSISEDGSVVLGTQVCTVPPSGMPRDTLLSSDFKVLLRFSCLRSPGAFTLLICTDLRHVAASQWIALLCRGFHSQCLGQWTCWHCSDAYLAASSSPPM